MKARIALFGWTRWPSWAPTPRSDKEPTQDTDYHRLTEWVEVDFPELAKEEQTALAVQLLTEERQHTVARFTAALKQIDDRLAELRALPAPEKPAAQPPPSEGSTATEPESGSV